MHILRILLATASLAVFSASPLPAHAAEDYRFMTAAEAAPHRATIDRVEQYLSKITTIVADFTQTAPDGSLTNGRFYLERPGKMRWQYNPPTPILIVSNGSELVFYDYELEQVSTIPLDSTVIGFMAREVIKFDDTVGLLSFEDKNGVIRVELAQRKSPEDGTLMLEFSDKPLALRNMVITDATRQVTSVGLNNARYGIPIDHELFIFRDPRKPRKLR